MKNISIHIIQWCFMILFVFDYHWFEVPWYEALGYSILEIVGYMVIFYLNVWILRRITSQKWIKSILYSVLIIVCYVVILKSLGADAYFYEATAWRNIFSMALNAGLFTGLAYLFFYSEQYIQTRENNLKLIAQNKTLQLDNLKSRINPHYIFNTLNNMNALIVRKDERLPTYLSKLSSVLRYAVDEGERDMIPLKKEMKYIHDYLDLVRLQEPASDNIDFYNEGIEETYQIIPFVLLTLIENAIKHGDLMQNEAAFLHINMLVEDECIIEIKNSFDSKISNPQGIGLENIRQQLDLVYKKGYTLQTFAKEEIYTCVLKIELSKISKT